MLLRASNLNGIERDELYALMDEMRPLCFTHSSQVSSYIMRHKLSLKYKNISGVVCMEKGGRTWDFKGGFPSHIYANICDGLGLGNNNSSAKVVDFTPFKNL